MARQIPQDSFKPCFHLTFFYLRRQTETQLPWPQRQACVSTSLLFLGSDVRQKLSLFFPASI
jgi:hypothetical protein